MSYSDKALVLQNKTNDFSFYIVPVKTLTEAAPILVKHRFSMRKKKPGKVSLEFKKERAQSIVDGYIQRTISGWEWRTSCVFKAGNTATRVQGGCEQELQGALNKVIFAEGAW